MAGGAEGEHTLLGAARFLVAPRAAEGRVEAVLVERLLQGLRLENVGVDGRGMIDRIDAALNPVLVDMHDEFEAELLRLLVAERDHVAEFPSRVDVEQGERRLLGPECLARKMQQDGGVLADRVHQDGLAELRRRLAKNVNALGLEQVEM